jgi:glutaredoxin-related protein
MNSIADAKKSQLMADETTREWLSHLAESTKSTDSRMQELIRAKHRRKMTVKYSDWPNGGPQKWIAEWRSVMGGCKIWCPSLYDE